VKNTSGGDDPPSVLREAIVRMEQARTAIACKDKALERVRHFLREIEAKVRRRPLG
jgi:hypothetical protein